jgi:hypothetical protein
VGERGAHAGRRPHRPRRVYDRLFPEFVNLYRSTRKIYARLNAER